MATAIPTSAIKRSFQPSFFFWMTVVMALFIFSGFALTYWLPMASGRLAPTPPIVHLHGSFFFSWMLLLIIQATLINTKNVQLHRSLGTFGIGLGTGVLILGTIITVLSARLGSAAPSPTSSTLTYLSFVALLAYGPLFVLAMRSTRQPENHKRLVLFATINLLPPGVNRLYMVSLGLVDVPLLATYLTLDALAIAILVYDWRTMKKISSASLIGAAFVFVPQLLYPFVVDTVAFARLTDFVGGLAYYR